MGKRKDTLEGRKMRRSIKYGQNATYGITVHHLAIFFFFLFVSRRAIGWGFMPPLPFQTNDLPRFDILFSIHGFFNRAFTKCDDCRRHISSG